MSQGYAGKTVANASVKSIPQNVSTVLLGPNPRRVGIIIVPLSATLWISLFGPAAAGVGLFLGTQSSSTLNFELWASSPESYLSNPIEVFQGSGAPLNVYVVEICVP